MRIQRDLAFLAFVTALALTACASRLQGEVSYAEGTDFSRYRSYALMPLASGALAWLTSTSALKPSISRVTVWFMAPRLSASGAANGMNPGNST